MRTGLLLAVSTLALWLVQAVPAAACKCLVPDATRSYNNAEHVNRVRVLRQVPAPSGQRRYLGITVGEAFKGCLPGRTLVLLETANESAACGATFRPGSEHLIHGFDGGRSYGLQVLQTNTCAGNRPWNELDKPYLTFLNTRCPSCGDGSCSCVDSELVQCFVDPCSVSTCAVEGARCSSNYCGGCNAEWTDASGAAVCQPGAVQCDNPRRNYVSEDPAACAAIDFICDPGTQMFFDSVCGCGCESSERVVVPPCRSGGCSGELCLGPEDPDRFTACVFRPEFACYQSARCEPQASGDCSFTQTPELLACLEAVGTSTP